MIHTISQQSAMRMKGSTFLRSSSSPISPFFFNLPPKPLINTLSCPKPISSHSLSSPQTLISPHKPQIPLFLRPPIYTTTFSHLQSFTNWAKTLATSIGSSFTLIDNGPDSDLLLRELKWVLDDVVEDPLVVSHLGHGGSCDGVVKLRVGVDELYETWRERVEKRRPFQYVVGCEHWRDLVLSVEDEVLIPRPETEKIVDLVEEVVGENEGLRDGVWGDLGTGSGALAIGIARVLGENGRVIATDLSPVAVSVATYNVERHSLQDRIEVRQGSWFDPLMHLEGELTGLVSNPPYIPSGDISGLQAEVGKHEPRLALDGGEQGLDHLIYLCKQAAVMLKSGGFFAFETNGEKQCRHLKNYIETETTSCFFDVNFLPDFAGIVRFVTGFRA